MAGLLQFLLVRHSPQIQPHRPIRPSADGAPDIAFHDIHRGGRDPHGFGDLLGLPVFRDVSEQLLLSVGEADGGHGVKDCRLRFDCKENV
jgi:hypothetical protein